MMKKGRKHLADDIGKMVDNITYRSSDYDLSLGDFYGPEDPRDTYGVYDPEIEPPTAPLESKIGNLRKQKQKETLVKSFQNTWPKFEALVDSWYSQVPHELTKTDDKPNKDGIRLVY